MLKHTPAVVPDPGVHDYVSDAKWILFHVILRVGRVRVDQFRAEISYIRFLTTEHNTYAMIRQDAHRIDPKRRAVIDPKKRQFATPTYKQQDYAHRLNIYEIPPTAEITLEQFEQWAIDRLKSMHTYTFISSSYLLIPKQSWPRSKHALIETNPPPRRRPTLHLFCRSSSLFPLIPPLPPVPQTHA